MMSSTYKVYETVSKIVIGSSKFAGKFIVNGHYLSANETILYVRLNNHHQFNTVFDYKFIDGTRGAVLVNQNTTVKAINRINDSGIVCQFDYESLVRVGIIPTTECLKSFTRWKAAQYMVGGFSLWYWFQMIINFLL